MADPYANLNPAFATRLQAFIEASDGLVSPGSGFRTHEQQATLYNRFKAGVPGQARAAPPGKSRHNFGLAMDLKYAKGGREWAHQNAARFGLYFPMSDEPWHIQPAGISADTEAQSGTSGLMEAGIDPQDELASRLNQIMQVLIGASPNTSSPSSLGTVREPSRDKYLNNLFTGVSPQFELVDVAEGDVGELQSYARQIMQEKYGWGPQEFKALVQLWNKESNWNPQAKNPTSSAAGIAQKMQSIHGPVEPTGQGQIDWGLQYIAGRYGTPTKALKHHLARNWY